MYCLLKPLLVVRLFKEDIFFNGIVDDVGFLRAVRNSSINYYLSLCGLFHLSQDSGEQR